MGVGTASASFEFYGLPAAADLLGALPKVSIVVQTSGKRITPAAAISLPVGTTKEQAAGMVATALEGLQDTGKTVTLHAVAAGAKVTVTEAKGAVITSLLARLT
jgi:hydroxyethylthiazole kinase-like sugar kinase family protein